MTHQENFFLELILRLHKITGTLLFYTKYIDLKILVALGKSSEAQTSGTIETKKVINKLIDYCTTHPFATLQ